MAGSFPMMKQVQHYLIDLNKQIGRGSFGTVYQATNTKNNEQLAVKVIPNFKVEEYSLEKALIREINIQKNAQSDHIVRLRDVKRTPNNIYIFADLCEGGDLQKKIEEGYVFTEQEACNILRQIVSAFMSMSKENIMHRDIKPANILINNGKVKITDFGFAKIIDEAEKEMRLHHTSLGTPFYAAPQILNDEAYSEKCDVWSTGCLFYQLLFGKLPWTANSVPSLFKNIKTNSLVFLKKILPETKDLLGKMLQIEEVDRISWKEILEHSALQLSSADQVK